MVDNAKLTSYERVLLVLVLIISLALRLTGLSMFTTSDEDRWYFRSVAFSTALEQHDWASTYQSGHPGVVTMWLGTIAGRLTFLQHPLPTDGASTFVQGTEPAYGAGIPPLTLGARRLVGLVTWLGVLALYPLLRRLFGARIALLGTAFVALDPFFLAHSRLHHLDALLTTFTTLSIACLLVYQFRGRRIGYLLASGVTAGLAIANKSPGVFLVPWAGVALVLPALLAPPPKRRQELLRSIGWLALWGAIAGLTLFAIWPAMWVNPLGTLKNVFSVADYYAETPHENGNFFWFTLRDDPGPAFYPVAWAFRTTPWVVLGLGALLASWRRLKERWLLGLLALGALAFAVAMTLGAKKFDRYLLPAFPLLDVIAAVGWVALLGALLPRLAERWRRLAPILGVAVLALTQLAWVWPAHPYYLCYYNPLFGGGPVAKNVMLVGWGEGLDQIAEYMNRKPDAADLVVCSWPTPEFGYFFVGTTIKDTKPINLAELDYVIFYRNSLQRDRVPLASRFVGHLQPERVLTLDGVDYAWVYENTLYDAGEQEVLSRINAEGDPATDVMLLDIKPTFARTYQGAVPVEIYQPIARVDSIQMGLQRIATGRRHIWYIDYPAEPSPDTSPLIVEQLEQHATVGQVIESGGVRATRYDLPAEPTFVAAPTTPSGVRYGEHITFLGYDVPDANLTPGQPFHIRLHWQTDAPLDRSYVVFVHLIGPDGEKYGQLDSVPQTWTFPTTLWKPGETVLDDLSVDLSPDAPVGGYVAVVGVYDVDTVDRLPVYDPAGNRLDNDVLVLGGFQVPEGGQ